MEHQGWISRLEKKRPWNNQLISKAEGFLKYILTSMIFKIKGWEDRLNKWFLTSLNLFNVYQSLNISVASEYLFIHSLRDH